MKEKKDLSVNPETLNYTFSYLKFLVDSGRVLVSVVGQFHEPKVYLFIFIPRRSQKRKKMKIQLDKERAKIMIEKIQLYIQEEFGESIGDLRAGFLLDFFINELGPSIYNQGINDAQAFIQDKLIDLEGSLCLEEN